MRDFTFRMRGYTPVPFLLVSLIWANPGILGVCIGLSMCAFGEFLRIYALRHAGGATRTRNVGAPELVTSGPYAHVRNPLYLANMNLYAGFSFASGAFFPVLPIVIILFFALQYSLIILLEEETLRKLFGKSYDDYCSKVPRLFPKFTNGSGNFNRGKLSLAKAIREERSTLMGHALSWSLLTVRVLFLPMMP